MGMGRLMRYGYRQVRIPLYVFVLWPGVGLAGLVRGLLWRLSTARKVCVYLLRTVGSDGLLSTREKKRQCIRFIQHRIQPPYVVTYNNIIEVIYLV
jgi:hypothetical protein